MGTSHDRVALTAEEQRILIVLDEEAGHNHRRLRLLMAVAARTAGLRSQRIQDAAATLVFLAGTAIMVGTFTRWLPVAVVGVVMQACALWWMVTRLAPQVNVWASAKKPGARSDTGETRRR